MRPRSVLSVNHRLQNWLSPIGEVGGRQALTRKLSRFLPFTSRLFSQRGASPRPDQVSPPGPRYLTAAFRPLSGWGFLPAAPGFGRCFLPAGERPRLFDCESLVFIEDRAASRLSKSRRSISTRVVISTSIVPRSPTSSMRDIFASLIDALATFSTPSFDENRCSGLTVQSSAAGNNRWLGHKVRRCLRIGHAKQQRWF